MPTVKFHPSEHLLSEFVQGRLEPNIALMVSAHCDMCAQCQEKCHALTLLAAGDILEAPKLAAFQSFDDFPMEEQDIFTQMMQNITELPALQTHQNFNRTVEPGEGMLDLDGKKFLLPRSLQRYAFKTQGWKKLVGKLWQAQVDLGGDARAEFIYMEQGGTVPEHTHRGNELTLVINGEFEDGVNCYGDGDLILLDSSNTHAPQSNDEEGCLVFSIVDQPLHFTSGLARLLNPFSHLFFK